MSKRTKRTDGLRSGFEGTVKAALDAQKIKYTYESEAIPYVVPESKHRYIPDFTLTLSSMVIEAKGKLDAACRKKMMLVIEQNPDRDIRFLFMRNNKLSKTSKTTYGEWCDSKNIKWAVAVDGAIPDSWVQENKEKDNRSKKRNRSKK